MAWKASIFIGYLLILGKGFEESLWVLIEGALWIVPVSLKDVALKEGGS